MPAFVEICDSRLWDQVKRCPHIHFSKFLEKALNFSPLPSPAIKRSVRQHEMESHRCSIILSGLLSLLIFSISPSASHSLGENFIQCLSYYASTKVTQILYTPNNSSYTSLLESTAKNLRFLTSSTPKPLFIITPLLDSHVQATVICSRKYRLQIKTRSGGHDFEGLSFTSDFPSFVMLDLVKMKSIEFNLTDTSAWVQTGATNGEVFYQLAQKTDTLGFPGGTYPTVGLGGLLSGGCMGMLLRKYGLAADHIVDARIVDANGRILDRKSMGEDLFWAIRGGGGASFGVILAWQIKLLPIPPIVTVFTVPKILEQGASRLLYNWQYILDTLPEDVFMRIMIQNVASAEQNNNGNRTIQISFRAFFLGRAEQLVQIMGDILPELGVQRTDCVEMRYIESIVYFSNYHEPVPIEALITTSPEPKNFVKAKSDFVKEPISEAGLEGLWKKCLEQPNLFLFMDSFGGKMNEISESELPFPHRQGNLFGMLYIVSWNNMTDSNSNLNWTRSVYNYMASYVSMSPRATYVNTRDLDIGRNMFGRKTSYSQAKVWGEKCFKNNFKRLALVKGKVDPTNFFMNEQSIPPLVLRSKSCDDGWCIQHGEGIITEMPSGADQISSYK